MGLPFQINHKKFVVQSQRDFVGEPTLHRQLLRWSQLRCKSQVGDHVLGAESCLGISWRVTRHMCHNVQITNTTTTKDGKSARRAVL